MNEMVCKRCFGLGHMSGEFDDCPYCNGTGFVEDDENDNDSGVADDEG